jgi:hypothetical protein
MRTSSVDPTPDNSVMVGDLLVWMADDGGWRVALAQKVYAQQSDGSVITEPVAVLRAIYDSLMEGKSTTTNKTKGVK